MFYINSGSFKVRRENSVSLCSNCILELIDKLSPNDIYLLHEIKDKTTVAGRNKKKYLKIERGNEHISANRR